MVIIRHTDYENSEGDNVTRYTPVIITGVDPLYSGSLNFAFYEVYTVEEPSKHKEAKVKAINNAVRVLDGLKEDFEKLKKAIQGA